MSLIIIFDLDFQSFGRSLSKGKTLGKSFGKSLESLLERVFPKHKAPRVHFAMIQEIPKQAR